jgi:hypothetical protein
MGGIAMKKKQQQKKQRHSQARDAGLLFSKETLGALTLGSVVGGAIARTSGYSDAKCFCSRCADGCVTRPPTG